jgi:hypothetical protein
MAETLGMLCDKLSVIKLKEYHTEDPARLENLAYQAKSLISEIDEYIAMAIDGAIPADRLVFASNKVFKAAGNEVAEVKGDLGDLIYQLADCNCRLWHQQEKVYDFETVPAGEKDQVVKKLALLNLERNRCIDSINEQFSGLLINKTQG